MCPICKKVFKSKACPHSTVEVGNFKQQQEIFKGLEPLIRKIVRDELSKCDFS